mmetsp:Transcript_13324/g.53092  ORF Transcript_13324/g.53092 Transcript_13324/m.53092 type:complete len:341 (-) Transcript_13324:29-1051(-)
MDRRDGEGPMSWAEARLAALDFCRCEKAAYYRSLWVALVFGSSTPIEECSAGNGEGQLYVLTGSTLRGMVDSFSQLDLPEEAVVYRRPPAWAVLACMVTNVDSPECRGPLQQQEVEDALLGPLGSRLVSFVAIGLQSAWPEAEDIRKGIQRGALSALESLYVQDECASCSTDAILAVAGVVERLSLLMVPHVGSVLESDTRRFCHLKQLSVTNPGTLACFPEDIHVLDRLEELSLWRCFEACTVPPSIGRMLALECLTLGCCQVDTLPTEFGLLAGLTELNIRYCQLKDFPKELSGLIALEVLTLEGNHRLGIPHLIFELPSLQSVAVSDSNRQTTALLT